MTVVSAMKFKADEGAIVADEQSSNTLRKYDIAEKLHSIEKGGVVLLYGGSGAADFLYEVHKTFQKIVPEDKDITCRAHMTGALGGLMTRAKMQFIDGHLRANYDLTLADLQRGYRVSEEGKSEIDPSIRQSAWNSIEKGDAVCFSGFLVLGKDETGVEIYTINTANSRPQICARPYSCIGSGSDMADGELASFIGSLPRDQRDSIPPRLGMAHLLYATDRASRMNVGVGGTPSIIYMHHDRIITPSESSSRLAGDIVRAARAGLLPEKFMEEALDELIFNEGDFRRMNSVMWDMATDKSKLDLLLRGYKLQQ